MEDLKKFQLYIQSMQCLQIIMTYNTIAYVS